MYKNHTKVAQTSTNLEALEKCMALMEDVLVHAGLWEIRTKMQGMNEEICTPRGKWGEATTKC